VDLLVSLVKNLPQIIAEIVRAIPQIITGIVGAIGSGVGAIVEAGANLMRGLVQGITSMVGNVVNSVKNAVGNVVNSVTSFLGIRSPSTVFAGIGRDMGAGIGVGFVDMMNQIAKDMQEAIPTEFNVDSNVRGAFSDGFGGAYSAGASFGGGAVTQNISITSPKALSEKEAAREFRNTSRKLALGIA
jgi:phage-related protein